MKQFNIQNKSGFTLVELLIVLGISGVIITLITSVFLTNLRSFNRSESRVELQHQAQFTMNYVMDKLIKSKGIEGIENKSKQNLPIDSYTGVVELGKLSFATTDQETEANIVESLHINHRSNKLIDGTTEVGDFIRSFKISPIPLNTTYSEAKGLSISMTFEISGEEITVNNEVYFRNHQN